MPKRQEIPLIIRFTTWLRNHPYDMKSCLPNAMIKLEDGYEVPCRKNILAAHSHYFKILFGTDPDRVNYQLLGFSSKAFETFVDFCYKRRIIMSDSKESQAEVGALADFLGSEPLKSSQITQPRWRNLKICYTIVFIG